MPSMLRSEGLCFTPGGVPLTRRGGTPLLPLSKKIPGVERWGSVERASPDSWDKSWPWERRIGMRVVREKRAEPFVGVSGTNEVTQKSARALSLASGGLNASHQVRQAQYIGTKLTQT
jgi:hypothetical protein